MFSLSVICFIYLKKTPQTFEIFLNILLFICRTKTVMHVPFITFSNTFKIFITLKQAD